MVDCRAFNQVRHCCHAAATSPPIVNRAATMGMPMRPTVTARRLTPRPATPMNRNGWASFLIMTGGSVGEIRASGDIGLGDCSAACSQRAAAPSTSSRRVPGPGGWGCLTSPRPTGCRRRRQTESPALDGASAAGPPRHGLPRSGDAALPTTRARLSEIPPERKSPASAGGA
jgi:hypothetical protein